MSSNDALIDSATRHQVFIQRYSAGQETKAQDVVGQLVDDINMMLADGAAELSKPRLDALILEIKQLSESRLEDLFESLNQEALEFIEYEAGFTQRMMEDNVEGGIQLPDVSAIQAGVLASVMMVEPRVGYSIREAMSRFGRRKSEQIVQAIKDGVTQGQTTPEIQGSVRSLKRLQQNQSAALVRTIVNHVSIQARNVTISENSNLFDGYEWVATLDARTSLICMSRDGIIYPFGDNPQTSPKPPAHFSCRSTIIPVVKPEFDLASQVKGKRPAKGAKGTTQVNAQTTYEQWLRRQPASFQDSVLGVSRGKLFRQGDLSIGRFVDGQGATLTLDELRQLEPLMFERLNL